MDRSYYKINEYLLCSIGQWPYQSKFMQILITLILSLDILSLFMAEILGLAKAWGNIDDIINCIPPFLFNLCSITCLTSSCFKKEKMTILLSKIRNDWSTWTTGPELRILREYANQGYKYVLVYSILIYINMIDFLAVPLLPTFLDVIVPLNESRPKRLIIDTDYLILDPEDDYYWIALHTSITTTLLMTVLVSFDSIFITILYHACGELAIIGFKLNNLTKVGDEMKIQQEIKFCAEKHKSVIIFVNDISDYFSTAYFLVLGFNMLMMSVTGVQTVMNLNKPHDAYTYAVFALGQIFHLFCLTVPCQHLIDHSISLTENIYNGYWYDLPLRSQKMLLTIMMRNTKPSLFTAGGLYVFSMENFASIVRTSMSYFTVLSSVRE